MICHFRKWSWKWRLAPPLPKKLYAQNVCFVSFFFFFYIYAASCQLLLQVPSSMMRCSGHSHPLAAGYFVCICVGVSCVAAHNIGLSDIMLERGIATMLCFQCRRNNVLCAVSFFSFRFCCAFVSSAAVVTVYTTHVWSAEKHILFIENFTYMIFRK